MEIIRRLIRSSSIGLLLATGGGWAQMVTPSGLIYTVSSGQPADAGFVKITSYTGPGGAVSIPESINGMPVRSVGNAAFERKTGITSISLPSSLTSIEAYAFNQCTNLASVNLPPGLQTIEAGAFSFCALTRLTIPASVTKIGHAPFNGCTSLSNLTVAAGNPAYISSSDGRFILTRDGQTLVQCAPGLSGTVIVPPTVRAIADMAFDNCPYLATVELPPGLQRIGNQAFWACINLSSLTLPESLLEIGEGALGLTALTSIIVPPSVIKIGGAAFRGNFRLTRVVLPYGLARLEGHTFWECRNLTEVVLPAELTSIGVNAFSECVSLRSITLPAKLSQISDGAFGGCVQLSALVCQGSPPSLGNRVFNGSGVTTVYYLWGAPGWGSTLGGIPTRSLPLLEASTQPSLQGLLLHLPFDGATTDLSPNARATTATAINYVADRAGHPGRAARFDGRTSHVIIPHSDDLALSADFTLSLWLKLDEATNQMLLAKHKANGAPTGWIWVRRLEGYDFEPPYSAASPALTSNAGVGRWAHLVFTLATAPRTYAFYVDGVLVGSGPALQTILTTDSTPLYVGTEPTINGALQEFLRGSLDEVRVYGRALSPAEVAALHAAESPANRTPTTIFAPTQLAGILGETATFTARAQNTTPLTYQWFKNGQPLTGQTRQTLNLPFLLPADAGSYTCQVSNPLGSSTSAPARLEVRSGTGSLRLINTSTRLQVGTGENILITGLVLEGAGERSFLIRAVGPTLQQFGVGNALARPQLTVFRGASRIAANEGWNESLRSIFTASGAFPLPSGSADAALVLSLNAGAYSFQVSGANNSSGTALLEVYELP